MDDAYGYEERVDEGAEAQLTPNGNYLCVHHEGQLRYFYRRVPAGAARPAPYGCKVYAGELYSLAWIEGEE
jgi:hypothetical protein